MTKNKSNGVNIIRLGKAYDDLRGKVRKQAITLKRIHRAALLLNEEWYGGKVANDAYNKLNKFYSEQVNYIVRWCELLDRLRPYYLKAKKLKK